MHIVYPHEDHLGADRQALAHELAHNLLYRFPLPLLLNEALARVFEPAIAGGRALDLSRHRGRTSRLLEPDDDPGLLVRQIIHKCRCTLELHTGPNPLDFIVTDVCLPPANLRDFVLHADRRDAGQAAAREKLGVELSDLVSTFLGVGEWAPKPDH